MKIHSLALRVSKVGSLSGTVRGTTLFGMSANFASSILIKKGPFMRCSRLLRLTAKPVRETCRAEARVSAWGEALIVHRGAGVERLGIGDEFPCVPGCGQ